MNRQLNVKREHFEYEFMEVNDKHLPAMQLWLKTVDSEEEWTLLMIIWRVGNEHEREITDSEVRKCVIIIKNYIPRLISSYSDFLFEND